MQKWKIFIILLLVPFFLLASCEKDKKTKVRFVTKKTGNIAQNEHLENKEGNILPLDEKTIREKIIPEAGVVSKSFWEGNSNKTVVVMEEVHTSRIGQIEIALMLVRLHKYMNVNTIGVEGAFKSNGKLDGSWFHDGKANLEFGEKANLESRESVALRLLEEGELNAVEFMAIVNHDANIFGIDNEQAWSCDTQEGDTSSPLIYLAAIAEKMLPDFPEKLKEYNDMSVKLENLQREIAASSDAEKEARTSSFNQEVERVQNFLLSSNPWTERRYDAWRKRPKNDIRPIEEELKTLEEIKATAVSLGVNEADIQAGMERLQKFYKTHAGRSDTMLQNSMSLLEDKTTAIALNIGSAHVRKTCDLLKSRNIRYVVIRPQSLSSNQEIGDLTPEAFSRKLDGKSVAEDGTIAALLEGRKKPPSFSQEKIQKRLQANSEIRLVQDMVAQVAQGGDSPPFDSCRREFARMEYVQVDTNSFVVSDEDGRKVVSFRTLVKYPDENNPQEFWHKVLAIENKEDIREIKESLEKELNAAISTESKTESQKKMVEVMDKLEKKSALAGEDRKKLNAIRTQTAGRSLDESQKGFLLSLIARTRDYCSRLEARLLAMLKRVRQKGIQDVVSPKSTPESRSTPESKPKVIRSSLHTIAMSAKNKDSVMKYKIASGL